MDTETTSSITALMRQQHGHITRDQLLRAGMPRSTIRRREDRGELIRVGGRTWRTAGHHSVVIDLGRKRRLFTCPAALAVKLSSTTCYWPGCHVPVTDCQSDHLTPWSTGRTGEGGGSANPRNGGPACGRHNRLRNHGFQTWRDPTGTWHVHRPDGTEIP